MSKGSNPRPFSVSQKEFAENWDNIFQPAPTPSKEDIATALAVRTIDMIKRGLDKHSLSRWFGDGMLWKLHLDIREKVAEKILSSNMDVQVVKNIILEFVPG